MCDICDLKCPSSFRRPPWIYSGRNFETVNCLLHTLQCPKPRDFSPNIGTSRTPAKIYPSFGHYSGGTFTLIFIVPESATLTMH